MYRERFEPAGRPMPATVQGLTALANERIEEAIARGLFKNLPRGKPIERDHHAESPFIDTTEYLLNRVIQRQEIVPPWIEKQQELAKEVKAFRGRLRAEWKRHVVRVLASWGGSGDEWVRRAEEFARAEAIANPDPVAAHEESTKLKEKKWQMDGRTVTIGEHIHSSSQHPAASTSTPPPPEAPAPPPTPANPEPAPKPFRDPTWQKTEYA